MRGRVEKTTKKKFVTKIPETYHKRPKVRTLVEGDYNSVQKWISRQMKSSGAFVVNIFNKH
jgi:hypothetical protein